MRPHQIISLLDFGANTMALPDHANHIHVGFQARFGANSKLGRQALAVLKPGQWSELLARLRQIQNPVVPSRPSRYALPLSRRERREQESGGPLAGASSLAAPPRRRRPPKVGRLQPLRALKPDRASTPQLKPLGTLGSR
jgi:hypothetical protein